MRKLRLVRNRGPHFAKFEGLTMYRVGITQGWIEVRTDDGTKVIVAQPWKLATQNMDLAEWCAEISEFMAIARAAVEIHGASIGLDEIKAKS